jgi:hypothetical protein
MLIPWIIPGALVAALALLAVRAVGPRLFAGTLGWRYAFRCPVKEQDVNAEFRESVWAGDRLEVERCSAFTPAEDVRCNKACLLLARLPRRKPAPFRPLGELCACWRLTNRAS